MLCCLDLDGTLYDQRTLHRRVLFDLLGTYATAPMKGYRTARVLRAFRQAQEALRSSEASGNLAAPVLFELSAIDNGTFAIRQLHLE